MPPAAKKPKTRSRSEGICPDWIYSQSASNHVATDRQWFDSYTPYVSYVVAPGGGKLVVLGIGTVNLPVKHSPHLTGKKSQGILKLTNVLHVDSVLCNIISPAAFLGCVSISDGMKEQDTGRKVVFFPPGLPFPTAKLSGPPTGPVTGPSVQTGGLFKRSKIRDNINLVWPEDEAKRWRNQNEEDEEDEKDKEEEEDEEDEKDEEEEEEEEDSFFDSSGDIMTQSANYLFDDDQLKYIRNAYGTSHNFMLSFGLKIWELSDCDEAQQIVEQMMNSGSDTQSDNDNSGSQRQPSTEQDKKPSVSRQDENQVCPDWMFATGSNVHVSSNLAWFDSYTKFDSYVVPVMGTPMKVAGVGTVSLPVKRRARRAGPGAGAHGIMKLKTVLHVPDGFCNIIGTPFMEHYSWTNGPGGTFFLDKDTGFEVAAFQENHVLFAVELSGPPTGYTFGPSPFDTDCLFCISVNWPEKERKRYEQLVEAEAAGGTKPGGSSSGGGSTPPYNPEEKAWLKKHWGGEFGF